jgi:uncharacterized YokU family protein
MMKCDWCESARAVQSKNTVYWELPDGTKAIEITDTPCITCPECGIAYQTEEMVKQIEDQLFLINTKQLAKSITYTELMNQQRLLKRNYFDFSS